MNVSAQKKAFTVTLLTAQAALLYHHWPGTRSKRMTAVCTAAHSLKA